MRRVLLVSIAALTVAVALAAPAVAQAADRATIPAGAPQPWGTTSPLARLAARIASHIARRPVTVRCETWNGWRALGQPGELGFVRNSYDPNTNRFAVDSNLIELAPQACLSLQAFAEATAKPTKCRPRPGAAPEPCFVGVPLARGGSGPGICGDAGCFSTATNQPNGYWHAYQGYAQALWALAHESIHVIQDRAGAPVPAAGLVESQAECSGLQWLPWVAVQFGDSGDDARSIATLSWELAYPETAHLAGAYAQSHPYWSPQCKPGGSLDIRAPGSTFWP